MAIYAAVRGAHGPRRWAGWSTALRAARRARQHADPLPVATTAATPRPAPTAARRASRPARRIRTSSAASPGPRWRTRRFRRYKHFNHEGGIATPLIAHWPARHRGRAASCARSPGIWSTSWPPASTWPARRIRRSSRARPIQPMEGRSLRAGLRQPADPARRALLGARRQRRRPRRRLEARPPRPQRPVGTLRPEEPTAPSCTISAAAQPERVKELAAKWDAWAERAQVKPYPAAKPAAKEKPKAKAKAAKAKAE